MAKIKKIYDDKLSPENPVEIYPITSTQAVYNTENVTVDALIAEGYRFGGLVEPTDSPALSDTNQRAFYFATKDGIYPNFGNQTVENGRMSIFLWNGSAWGKQSLAVGSANIAGYKVLVSVNDLPRQATSLGYLIEDTTLPEGVENQFLYVWVGEGGDTLEGMYQNCGQLRGASAYEVARDNGYEGTQEEWLNDPVNGIKGVGISKWELSQSTADSGVSTITVTLNTGDVETFDVYNGKGIASVEVVGSESSADSATNTYRVTYSDGNHFDFHTKNGKGIASIAIVGSYSDADGATNTYRVTYSDGNHFDFNVKNGNKGNSGYSGAAGELEVVNSLDSTDATAALSAAQGKVLKDLHDTDKNIVNVNDLNGTPTTPYNNADAARIAVSSLSGLRITGQIITYLLADGWHTEQFIGSDVTNWTTASNWLPIAPITVSQNSQTGHTDINIGSDSYPVPSVAEVGSYNLDKQAITDEGITGFYTIYGTFNATANYFTIKPILLKPGYKIEHYAYIWGTETSMIFLSNANGDFVSNIEASTGSLQVFSYINDSDKDVYIGVCYDSRNTHETKTLRGGLSVTKLDKSTFTSIVKEYKDIRGAIGGIYKTSGDTVITTVPDYTYLQQVIPCISGDKIALKGYGGSDYRLWAFVDASNNILLKSGVEVNATDDYIYVTAPINSVKIIVSCYYSYRNALVIVKNGILLEALKRIDDNKNYIKINENSITAINNNLNSNISCFERIDFSVDSHFISIIDGSVSAEVAGYAATDFIEVDRNKVYIFRGTYEYNVAYISFYNQSQEWISSLPNSATDPEKNLEKVFYPSEFPANTKYIKFSVRKDKVGGVAPCVICCSPRHKMVQDEKRLETKTMHFIGDSVMIGRDNLDAVKSITYFLTNKYGLKCVNHGAGGAILTSSPLHYARIYNQLTSLPNNADVIIMQGGLNGVDKEATTAAPWGWGEISNSFETTFNTVLQIPCLEAMCEYVVNHYPNKKYGFIINYDIQSYNYWQEKAEKIKEVLDKWGIPYFDWRHTGINLASNSVRSKYGVDAWAIYPAYDATSTYDLDDRVIYDGKTYKANQNISTPEEFNPDHWDLIATDRYDGWHCNALAYEQLADKTIEWIKSL